MSWQRTEISSEKIFRLLRLLIFIATVVTAGCADTLLTADGYAGKPPGGTPQVAATTTNLGNGIYETNIDATSYSTWGYFDFEAGDQIVVTDPATNSNWDLGFQRYMIKLNGGVSGNGGATVLALNADNFSARSQAPNPFSPAAIDVADAGDANDACRPTTSGVLFAMLNSAASPSSCWFGYASGVLTPRDITYIIKTATPKYYKIKMVSYYGPTGTSGKIRFQWGEVTAP